MAVDSSLFSTKEINLRQIMGKLKYPTLGHKCVYRIFPNRIEWALILLCIHQNDRRSGKVNLTQLDQNDLPRILLNIDINKMNSCLGSCKVYVKVTMYLIQHLNGHDINLS